MGGVEGIAVMVDDVAMPKYNDNRKLGLILLIDRTICFHHHFQF